MLVTSYYRASPSDLNSLNVSRFYYLHFSNVYNLHLNTVKLKLILALLIGKNGNVVTS